MYIITKELESTNKLNFEVVNNYQRIKQSRYKKKKASFSRNFYVLFFVCFFVVAFLMLLNIAQLFICHRVTRLSEISFNYGHVLFKVVKNFSISGSFRFKLTTQKQKN